QLTGLHTHMRCGRIRRHSENASRRFWVDGPVSGMATNWTKQGKPYAALIAGNPPQSRGHIPESPPIAGNRLRGLPPYASHHVTPLRCFGDFGAIERMNGRKRMRGIAIIEAPSVLGLRPTGVEKLPDALNRAGLSRTLNARKAARVESAPYSEKRDPQTGFLNAREIADYARRLAAEVERVLEVGNFPLVLGGDCSILLGSMLALKRRGRHGLLFLDGHMDFYQPEANINGEVASSELALVTGRGPALLTTYAGH